MGSFIDNSWSKNFENSYQEVKNYLLLKIDLYDLLGNSINSKVKVAKIMAAVMYFVSCVVVNFIGIVVDDVLLLSKENLLKCRIFIVKYSTN